MRLIMHMISAEIVRITLCIVPGLVIAIEEQAHRKHFSRQLLSTMLLLHDCGITCKTACSTLACSLIEGM